MTREGMISIIHRMADLSDESLDTTLAAECGGLHADTGIEEVRRFLRDLLDQIVHIAGANGFVMALIRAMLEGSSETDEQKHERRAALANRMGIKA